MPVFVLEPIWNQAEGGFGEAYITKQISDGNLQRLAQDLVNHRSNLLFGVHNWLGLRVGVLPLDPNAANAGRESRVYLTGDSELDQGGKLSIPGVGRRTALTGGVETADQLNACLQMRVKFDDTRSTIRFLAGIPDGISAAEPAVLDQTRNPDWWKVWNVFAAWMVGNTRILGLSNTGDFAPVKASKVSLSAAAPSDIVVSVKTADAKPIAAGDKVLLSKFRRKKDQPGLSLNGTFYVDAVSTTTFTGMTSYTIRGTSLVPPDAIKILGTVRKKGFAYHDVQKVDPYRVRTRQRGGPSLRRAGRRLTRLSADP